MIQEPLSFIKGPSSLCMFKLLGLSSILGSVTSINFHSIFLSISVFLFQTNSQISCLFAFPTLIDQSNESILLDFHHLVSEPGSRFGIAMEVYYTRCLIEGHPRLVAYDYGSNNNVVSQRLVKKLQLPASFHPNQAWIKFSTR